MQCRLSTIKHRVSSCWIKLDSSKAALDFAHRSLGGSIWIVVHRIIGVHVNPDWWIEIGICAQFVVHTTAQQFVNRFASLFAADIPHGHLNATHDATSCEIRSQRISAAVHIAPHHFDMKRIASNDVSLCDFFNHLGDKMRRISCCVDLANSRNTRISSEFDKNKIATTKTWWWVSHHKCFDVDNFHELAVA